MQLHKWNDAPLEGIWPHLMGQLFRSELRIAEQKLFFLTDRRHGMTLCNQGFSTGSCTILHSWPRGITLPKNFLSIFFILHWDKKFQKWLFYPGLHFSRGKKFFWISNFSWVCTQKHRKQKKCVYPSRIFLVFCVFEYILRKN